MLSDDDDCHPILITYNGSSSSHHNNNNNNNSSSRLIAQSNITRSGSPPPTSLNVLAHVHHAHQVLEQSLHRFQEQMPAELSGVKNAIGNALLLQQKKTKGCEATTAVAVVLPQQRASGSNLGCCDVSAAVAVIAEMALSFRTQLHRFEKIVNNTLHGHSQRLSVIGAQLENLTDSKNRKIVLSANSGAQQQDVDLRQYRHKNFTPRFFQWTMRVAACHQFIKEHLHSRSSSSSSSSLTTTDRDVTALALSAAIEDDRQRKHHNEKGNHKDATSYLLNPPPSSNTGSNGGHDHHHHHHHHHHISAENDELQLTAVMRMARERVQAKSQLLHNLQKYINLYAKRQTRLLAELTLTLRDATDAARDAHNWCTRCP
ncbi:Hypothetical protein, putative [Bodo saltans]|uniref:Uncharacterized protein n=1 Tax=Bodo saltans TaxID=75058 RepID=A0A0S4JF64_BODSA|nr:Hypothetical protein, putative [Bodo saltans]|eukprot:CUG90194.1 Hypothetical protein, putative [Bodo saltans]